VTELTATRIYAAAREEISSSGIQPNEIFGFQFKGPVVTIHPRVILLDDLYFVERSTRKDMGLFDRVFFSLPATQAGHSSTNQAVVSTT